MADYVDEQIGSPIPLMTQMILFSVDETLRVEIP